MNDILHVNTPIDFTTLKEKVLSYNKEANINMLKKAFDLAKDLHKDQKRVDGKPYFIHPFNVALILSELKMDTTCICAGLLHDVVEDTHITFDDIEREFSPIMVRLIKGVTKISKLVFKSRLEFQAENIKKMLLAMSEDIRVVIIKLADRLHNIATLDALPPAKQKRIARETLDIYSPLAHRLGMHKLKSLLEDFSLKALEPEIYEKIKTEVDKRARERDKFINDTIEILKRELKKINIQAHIYGRAKHFYSIYLKMIRDNKKIDEIYDLLAIRIITTSVRDCYSSLGVVHELWPPIPGRFKDYIAMPKPNMYQSLHTTVMQKFGNKAIPIEIQIRTKKMDEIAEVGIAAHWDYKERKQPNQNKSLNKKIAWLRQLIDWHTDIKDAADFIHNLKNDLFQDEVFVFSPAGDVMSLPASATPLDFAFSIHTEVGIHCIGAKVNGKIVPLDYSLSNGDVIEIITSKNAHPNPSWLDIVKSHKAKNKIRQYLRKIEKEHYIKLGREHLSEYLKKIKKEIKQLKNSPLDEAELKLSNFLKHEKLLNFINNSEFKDVNAMLAAIGRDELSVIWLFNRVFPEWKHYTQVVNRLEQIKKNKPKKSSSTGGIIVDGIANPMIVLSKCCNPLPGDRIVGYVTRGRGISVHRIDCPNFKVLSREKERIINLKWDIDRLKGASFITSIRLEVLDRPNLLFDITKLLSSELKLNITNLKARGLKDGKGIIDVNLELKEFQDLNNIIHRLTQVNDVINAYRLK